VLAITGGKGGVGKTTTALGVAAAAARRGREPIVVDADVDLPDLATVAGTDGRGLARFDGDDPIDVAGTRVAGVTVLGARLDDDSPVEPTLRRLSGSERLVVVDCPAGAGEPATRPLAYANRSVVATTGTERALADGRKAAEMAERLGAPTVCVARCRCDRDGPDTDRYDVPVVPVPAVAAGEQWRGAETAYGRLYERITRQNA
jgi:septum site-determining protein MinD